MKQSKLRWFIVLGGLLLAAIPGIYQSYPHPRVKGLAGQMPVGGSLKDTMAETATASNIRQTAVPKTGPLRRSKQAWLEWINACHPFTIENPSKLYWDIQVFKRIGFEAGGLATLGAIRERLQDVWGAGDMEDIAKFQEDGISKKDPDFMPIIVSVSETASTFRFRSLYSKNRYEILKGRINDFLKWGNEIPDEERSVGPEWAEAVTEWCFAQPVLRRFGNSELTVTFEDIELEGKRGFRVTESMPGLESGPPVINQFTSAEIPAPYNQYLLINQEFQN